MRKIADSTVRRLSLYLRYLEEFETEGQATVSSEALATRGGTTSAQVRKDLSFFGSFGKRGLGYPVAELGTRLRDILGLSRRYRLVVVGAGKIGSALAQYRGFRQRGFDIVAMFDNDGEKVGKLYDGVAVRDVADLDAVLEAEQPDIGVIVVPGDQAQAVAERLVRGGVKAILNFAPAPLQVPDDVSLKNVNLALELEALSFALASQRH
jgi:redox-sensing transcriptional repressor